MRALQALLSTGYSCFHASTSCTIRLQANFSLVEFCPIFFVHLLQECGSDRVVLLSVCTSSVQMWKHSLLSSPPPINTQRANISVAIKTIVTGLTYLLTFIFGANTLGLSGEGHHQLMTDVWSMWL